MNVGHWLWVLLTAFVAAFQGYGTGNAIARQAVTAESARPQPSEYSTRPNIVLIISDDQGWRDYGFMGHPTIRTPHLDQLARNSILFRRGYVPTSLCRPSLMTLITGRYAHQHGITGNDPSPDLAPAGSEPYRALRQRLIDRISRFETLAGSLARAGYVCFQSGKWWEGGFERGGFTHGMTRGFPNPGGRHGDLGLKIGRDGLGPITAFVDQAIEDEAPFFVWYAPFMPHTPHNPPERLLDHYRSVTDSIHEAKYDAMCEWFDETCGQLIEHLESRDVLQNTLVVYVTDNGWIQRDDQPRFADRSKQSPFEGGVRTPIMFHWPAQLPPGERTELCSSIDLMPTILAAAGVEAPDDLPGLNLLEAMKYGQLIEREAIFGEVFAHDIADLDNVHESLLYRWCIEGDWKLIVSYDGTVGRYRDLHERMRDGPRLFDLGNDPHETVNLASAHPERVRRLMQRLDQWYATPRRPIMEPVPHPGGQ